MFSPFLIPHLTAHHPITLSFFVEATKLLVDLFLLPSSFTFIYTGSFHWRLVNLFFCFLNISPDTYLHPHPPACTLLFNWRESVSCSERSTPGVLRHRHLLQLHSLHLYLPCRFSFFNAMIYSFVLEPQLWPWDCPNVQGVAPPSPAVIGFSFPTIQKRILW